MRKLTTLFAALAMSMALAAASQEMNVTKIHLRYVETSEILGVFQARRNKADANPPATVKMTLPSGITSLVAHDEDNSLLAEGTPQGLERLKAMVQRLDVQKKQILLKARIFQIDFTPDGIANMKLVSAPSLTTFDNVQATTDIKSNLSGYGLTLTPHVNSDWAINLSGESHLLGKDNRVVHTTKISGTLGKEHSWLMTGVTDSPDAGVQKAVQMGQLPHQPGKYVAYLFQISATVEPAH